jgi:hypothetical protein
MLHPRNASSSQAALARELLVCAAVGAAVGSRRLSMAGTLALHALALATHATPPPNIVFFLADVRTHSVLVSVRCAPGPATDPHRLSLLTRAAWRCCRLTQDLGYNNIGYHNHVTLSPHIDEFFSTGLQLNHSFSHKWCAPTRGALMSGRLPYKTGLEHGSLGVYSAPEYTLALSANFTLLPATLKKAGYTTHSAFLPATSHTRAAGTVTD